MNIELCTTFHFLAVELALYFITIQLYNDVLTNKNDVRPLGKHLVFTSKLLPFICLRSITSCKLVGSV